MKHKQAGFAVPHSRKGKKDFFVKLISMASVQSWKPGPTLIPGILSLNSKEQLGYFYSLTPNILAMIAALNATMAIYNAYYASKQV